jgi:hypothetical protein
MFCYVFVMFCVVFILCVGFVLFVCLLFGDVKESKLGFLLFYSSCFCLMIIYIFPIARVFCSIMRCSTCRLR